MSKEKGKEDQNSGEEDTIENYMWRMGVNEEDAGIELCRNWGLEWSTPNT